MGDAVDDVLVAGPPAGSSIAVEPGATTLTVMSRPRSSLASIKVMESTTPFMATKVAWHGGLVETGGHVDDRSPGTNLAGGLPVHKKGSTDDAAVDLVELFGAESGLMPTGASAGECTTTSIPPKAASA